MSKSMTIRDAIQFAASRIEDLLCHTINNSQELMDWLYDLHQVLDTEKNAGFMLDQNVSYLTNLYEVFTFVPEDIRRLTTNDLSGEDVELIAGELRHDQAVGETVIERVASEFEYLEDLRAENDAYYMMEVRERYEAMNAPDYDDSEGYSIDSLEELDDFFDSLCEERSGDKNSSFFMEKTNDDVE
jgi:hypothetical protein